MEDSVLGLGASVIPFSGLKIEYFSVGGDFSYMKIGLKGQNSFLGFGGGFGGMYSRDYNFSEKGKRIHFTEEIFMVWHIFILKLRVQALVFT
jgi:hypothetical protein